MALLTTISISQLIAFTHESKMVNSTHYIRDHISNTYLTEHPPYKRAVENYITLTISEGTRNQSNTHHERALDLTSTI